MLTRSLVAPSTAACALLLALTPPAAELSFHPEEGRSLTKTFAGAMAMDLDELSLLVDGQDLGAMMGDMSFRLTTDWTYVVSDEYVALAEGRPAKLQRTFDELTQEQEVSMDIAAAEMSDTQSSASASDLEGLSVLFTWNADSEEYDVAFADGDGDTDLLDGLEEDMDLRALLPDGEVSEGDSWELDAESLASLAMPGGNLKLIPDDADEESMEEFEEMFEELGEEFGELFEESLDGDSTATFTGTREVDGKTVGVVALELDVSMSVDLTDVLYDVIDELMAENGAPEGLEIDLGAAQLDASFTGTGELLWDMGAGLVHALELSGEMEVSMDIAVDVDAEGEAHTLEAFFAMVGDLKSSVAAE